MKSFTDAYQAKVSKKIEVLDAKALEGRSFPQLFPTNASQPLKRTQFSESESLAELSFIVSLMREKPGLNVEKLVKETGLSYTEVRQFIRVIISLGGQVEVLCEKSGRKTVKRLFLHN